MPQIESTPVSIAQNANGIFLRKPAHAANVLLVGERVDDQSGRREELRLEERVREEVRDPPS